MTQATPQVLDAVADAIEAAEQTDRTNSLQGYRRRRALAAIEAMQDFTISSKEADALIRVLSLAENHPMWTEAHGHTQEFKDETYAAISTVREFLKKNDVLTMHEVFQQAAARAAARSAT
jgi:hypothetical protein